MNATDDNKPEFGHHASVVKVNGYNCHIDSWGSGPFVLNVERRSFRFEDSDRFGPSLVNKDGEIKAKPYPAASSPFWRWHRLWVRQGRRTEEDWITCIVDPPKPTKYRRIGKMRVIIENGDPDGDVIEVNPFDVGGNSQ